MTGLPPSIEFTGTFLYTWVERGTVSVKRLAQNTTQCLWPGLEPEPFDPDSSTLTMRPPCLPPQKKQPRAKSQPKKNQSEHSDLP